MRLFIALALGVACAGVVIACGGGPAQRKVTGPGSMAPVVQGGDVKLEIEQLERDIDSKLDEMKLARPAVVQPPVMSDPLTMGAQNLTSAQDPQCGARGQNDTCNRSCTLADSICTNAARICNLADKLGEDAWARGKCANSTETCRVAHQSCCSCM